MNTPRPLIPPPVEARARSHGRMSFGFASRFFMALLLGFVWLIPAWWMPHFIAAMFLWDCLALLVYAFDLFGLPKPSQLLATRTWEHAPSLATASSVALTVRNLGRTSIRCSLTDETSPALRKAPPNLSLDVPANRQNCARYPILPRERGDLRLGRLFLRYQSVLAFAERWAVADLSQSICVVPDLEQARQHALYLIRSRQVEMEKRRRHQRGHSREFQSLREYRQGDELRDLCWTATARHHRLTTRVFEVERSQAVWILLDAGRLLRAEIIQDRSDLRLAKLDYAVNAALSLAQVANQFGDRVGLLAYGRRIQQHVPVGRGPSHLRSLVDRLAHVRAEASEADHTAAARLLLTKQSRRALVVWITDFSETPTTPEVIEYAMQMTGRYLVLFAAVNQPDLNALACKVPENINEMYRHAAALEIAERRDLLLRGLRQHGVFAFELVPGLLASSIVNQYLDIKERSLL